MVECLNGMKPVSGAVFLAKKTNDSAVFALRKQTNLIPLIRSNTKTAFGRFILLEQNKEVNRTPERARTHG